MLGLSLGGDFSFTEFVEPLWLDGLVVGVLIAFLLLGKGGKSFLGEGTRKKGGASASRRGPHQAADALTHEQQELQRLMEVEISAGHPEKALEAWDNMQGMEVPLETLSLWTKALAHVRPTTLASEVVQHMQRHPEHFCNAARSAHAVMEQLAVIGAAPAVLDDFAKACLRELQLPMTKKMVETLLGAYAAAGDEGRVSMYLSEPDVAQQLSARGYMMTIRGFLRNGLLEAALQQVQLMYSEAGLDVPPNASAAFYKRAVQTGEVAYVYESFGDILPLTSDSVDIILEECSRRSNLELADKVWRVARDQRLGSVSAYDSILKLYAAAGRAEASDVFRRMQTAQHRISNGLCAALLARCAESKFLSFAHEVADYARSKNGMSLQVYSALMKVYAFTGKSREACDLFKQLRQEDLRPDALMCCCMLKFAMECGRTELLAEILETSPMASHQHFTSMIRAAGKEKNVDAAFVVLERMKTCGMKPDAALYNCLLDVCVSANDVPRAIALVEEMKEAKACDVVSFNTLLKGLCQCHDFVASKKLLLDMKRCEVAPNEVTYNSFLNACVDSGHVKEAWDAVALFEQDGLACDAFTISILMKSLRKAPGKQFVQRAFDLLDRSGVALCSDEVLLNAVLDVSTKFGLEERLRGAIQAVSAASFRPMVHTYGCLIKAASTLGDIESARHFWHDMVEVRKMAPTPVVLGCMLDALVCLGGLQEAMALFRQWTGKLQANAVMYSMLFKGCLRESAASLAVQLLEEMHEAGVETSLQTYNLVLDMQARHGETGCVEQLLALMRRRGFQPDVNSYSTAVAGRCSAGFVEEAMHVYRSLPRAVQTEEVIFNNMLDGCLRQGYRGLAEELVKEALVRTAKQPCSTARLLVLFYSTHGCLDKAFDIVRNRCAEDEKSNPTGMSRLLASLTSACLQNNATERGLEVFHRLKALQPGPDSKCCSRVVSYLVRQPSGAWLEEAVKVVREVYGLSAQPRLLKKNLWINDDTLQSLFQALHQKGLSHVANKLLEDLRAAGVRVKRQQSSAAPQRRSLQG
eukprot:TRINITY_DN26383_c1_g2_i1.p1 TRINITY_DN26383_c1_g2~~TRINITY_DN26383_c1_g2_i1.p1  ORF type:complete len:1038 (-),score=276.81 TRINITY_DN26383_c1_g2_i1:126-3239(-)